MRHLVHAFVVLLGAFLLQTIVVCCMLYNDAEVIKMNDKSDTGSA
jgi:hypothetical protein